MKRGVCTSFLCWLGRLKVGAAVPSDQVGTGIMNTVNGSGAP